MSVDQREINAEFESRAKPFPAVVFGWLGDHANALRYRNLPVGRTVQAVNSEDTLIFGKFREASFRKGTVTLELGENVEVFPARHVFMD